jgi:hypothetical protein
VTYLAPCIYDLWFIRNFIENVCCKNNKTGEVKVANNSFFVLSDLRIKMACKCIKQKRSNICHYK